MRVDSYNMHPEVYKPNEKNTLTAPPNLNDCTSNDIQFKFGQLDHSNFVTLDLSRDDPYNSSVDESLVQDIKPQDQVKSRFEYINEGTHHYFLTKSLDFVKTRAKRYAAYLNPEAFKDEDIPTSVFYGSDKLYDRSLKSLSYDYAKGAIEFFSMKKTSHEDIDKLTNQFTSLIKEYGTLLAENNSNTEDLDSKLTINGVDMTFDELDITTQAMKAINKNLDKSSMLKHAHFAQLGLGITQMKYISQKHLPKNVGDMVMSAYNKRAAKNIDYHNTRLDLSKEFRKVLSKKLEERIGVKLSELPVKDTYCDPYYSLDTKYEVSGKKDIMSWFSNIDITSEETIKQGFESSKAKFNSFQNQWAIQRQYGLYSSEKITNQTLINKSYDDFFNVF